MKRHAFVIAAVALHIFAAPAAAYDLNDWPVHYTFGDGTDIGLTGVYRYDLNDFSDDTLPNGSSRFDDSHTNRRKELGLTLKKKGVYDAVIAYEYQAKSWQDVNIRLQSKAFLGQDYGAFRFGYSKTPVAFEGVTSSKATSFLELSLPAQAIFEGRRSGIDWAFERPQYLLNLGYYWGQDLQGDNDGTTVAGRVAWTPRKSEGDVIHLGVSASQESPDATTDGRGVRSLPGARIRAVPEAGLTSVRLVDSGALSNADSIRRSGLEGLWIRGPWSVQGELLNVEVERKAGKPDYGADGFYVFGSWVVTGESRPYSGGNTNNLKPKGAWGAWELLLRYSELDLDDGAIRGGKQHDWTLGANWYLTQHFKFQANYIQVSSDRAGLSLDPRIFELRAQIYF